MSFGVAFALPARIQTLNAGASPFGQLGPTLDLVFAGIPTDPLNTLVGTLDLFFTRPLYEIAEAYSVWEIPVGMVAKTFSQIITFTRASNATYFDAAGVLQTATTDVPRFDYNPVTLEPLGFLIEESRTNSIRNNTMQGAAAGTPGTAPTNWDIAVSGTGITQQIVGTGTEDGITYIDVRFSGTGSGSPIPQIRPETTTQIVAAASQTWASSYYLRIVGGSTTGCAGTFQQIWQERDAAGVALNTVAVSISDPTTAALKTQRSALVRTLTDAGTARLTNRIQWTFTNGVAVDITLRIGLPQLEQGAFATSVIPTTTVAVTRSADVASVNTLSPWYNAAEGTLYAEVALPVLSATANQNTMQFSDGTSSNRIALYRQTSGLGTALSFGTTINGSAWANTAIRKIALGNQSGNSALAENGAITGTGAGTAVQTVNQLRLGSNHDGTGGFANGYLRRVTYYPRVLTAAELRTLTLPAGATLSTQDYSLDTDFTGNTVSVGA